MLRHAPQSLARHLAPVRTRRHQVYSVEKHVDRSADDMFRDGSERRTDSGSGQMVLPLPAPIARDAYGIAHELDITGRDSI